MRARERVHPAFVFYRNISSAMDFFLAQSSDMHATWQIRRSILRFNQRFKLIQIYIQRKMANRTRFRLLPVAVSSSVYTAWVWIYRSTGDADKRHHSPSSHLDK